MVQIIPRTQSRGEKMAQALQGIISSAGNIGEMFSQNSANKQEKDQLSEIIGQDVRKIRNPDFLKEIISSRLQNQNQSSKSQEEQKRKEMAFQKIQQTPYWQNASDAQKALIESEMFGDMSAQMSKSLVNLERENSTRQFLEQLFSEGNQESNQGMGFQSDQGFDEGMEPMPSRSPSIPKNKMQQIPEDKLMMMIGSGGDLANVAQAEINRRKEAEKMSFEREKFAASQEKEGKESKGKLNSLKSGLETVKRMKQIGKAGNLGVTSSAQGLINPNVRRDRAEYQRLGKSLISLSSNIPIRNQQEFEVLAHDLYDASITDAAREGILKAMERIISQSMKEFESEGPKDQETSSGNKKERPPLTSFHR